MPPRTRARPLHVKVLIGLALGAAAGIGANLLARHVPESAGAVRVLADGVAHPIGQLFLRGLFLVVVPLVFASLSVGVANLGNLKELGSIGWRTLAFFLVTTAFSVCVGLFVMNTFRPGVGFDQAAVAELMKGSSKKAAEVSAAAALNKPEDLLGYVNQWLDYFVPRNVLKAVVEMQMLPLIVFALLLGVALTALDGEKRKRMVGWLESLGEAMVVIVNLIMRLAPVAVGCLIFVVTAKLGIEVLQKLAFYVALVFGAYIVQLFVLYPVLVKVLARRSPVEFMREAIPVMVTAFTTSSSNATLPTTLRVTQERLGVRAPVAGFVIPLGATMNMNGTALFEGAVVLFVAQVFGVHLDLGRQLLVVLLSVFSAVGAAGVPGGSLPLLMIVMQQVGVNPDGIALILGVDRLLDMGRTVLNVVGDMACAVYIERVERERGA